MLRFLKSFFGKQTPPEAEVPYKVEAPVSTPDVAPQPEPIKCGCGRSPSGFCVGLHKLTGEEWAVHPDNPVKPVVVEAKKPAAKKPAAKKPADKKPAAMTASKKRPSKKTPV